MLCCLKKNGCSVYPLLVCSVECYLPPAVAPVMSKCHSQAVTVTPFKTHLTQRSFPTSMWTPERSRCGQIPSMKIRGSYWGLSLRKEDVTYEWIRAVAKKKLSLFVDSFDRRIINFQAHMETRQWTEIHNLNVLWITLSWLSFQKIYMYKNIIYLSLDLSTSCLILIWHNRIVHLIMSYHIFFFLTLVKWDCKLLRNKSNLAVTNDKLSWWAAIKMA